MPAPFAFVSLVTSDHYLPGALAVAAAIKDLHPARHDPPNIDFQTLCLVTPESVDVSTIKLLRRAYDAVVGVELIEQEDERGLNLLGRPDLTHVLTKLHVFRLTQYSKIIFLDADVLPIRPLSHLFSLPYEFAAVPDVGWPDIFNSGVLVLTPGHDKFDDLMQLLKTKGSWDGGDQGLLNEWRGDDWHRLSFTYNTTPTAAYTYAPAYERFGSQISAIHFIGPNKPWVSIPYRAPGLKSAQPPEVGASTEQRQQQAYDFNSLVDRWYEVYDKHYRSDAPTARAEFELRRYASVWDDGSEFGTELPTVADSAAGAPPGSALGLEDLRRIAVEGISNFGGSLPETESQVQIGEYRSMPLEGRVDLMRPRREPPPEPEMKGEGAVQDEASKQEEPPRQEEGGDRDLTPKQELYKPLHIQEGNDGEPRMYTLPTPGPNEVPPAPYMHGRSLPPSPYFPPQQQGQSSSHPYPSQNQQQQQQQQQQYYDSAHQQSQYQPPQGSPSRQRSEHGGHHHHYSHLNHVQDRRDSSQSPPPQQHQHHHSHRHENRQEHHRPSVHPHSSPPTMSPSHPASPQYSPTYQHQSGPQHRSAHQSPSQFHSAYQSLAQDHSVYHPASRNHSTHQLPRYSSQPSASQYYPTSQPSVQYNIAHPQSQHHSAHHSPTGHFSTQRSLPRPSSPPKLSWNPALEPPPNDPPVPDAFPADTYFPNVWDQAPQRHDALYHSYPSASSPQAPTLRSDAFFSPPPPSHIPEQLVREGQYANVIGHVPPTGPDSPSPQPVPDRSKVHAVFPWEDKPRHVPGRVFPATDSPPPSVKYIEEEVQSSPPQEQHTLATAASSGGVTPSDSRSATQAQVPSPSAGLPYALSYSNAWDTVPSIQKYASRLVRPHNPIAQYLGTVNSPQRRVSWGNDDGWKRWEKERERDVQARQDADSMDGDDEDDGSDEEWEDRGKASESRGGSGAASPSTRRSRAGSSSSATGGRGKKYRNRGVQTTVVETRSQGVQVKIVAPEDVLAKPVLNMSVASMKHDMASSPIKSTVLLPAAPVRDQRVDPDQMGSITPVVSHALRQSLPFASTASPTGFRSPQTLGSPRSYSPPKVKSPPRGAAPPGASSPPKAPSPPRQSSPPVTSAPPPVPIPPHAPTARRFSATQQQQFAPSPRKSSLTLGTSPSKPASPVVGPSTPPPHAPSPKLSKLASPFSPPMARTSSNDTALTWSPSTQGAPPTPENTSPPSTTSRKGGRVWDPARGVDVFKRSSEEVLARFLKMESFEDDERRQGQVQQG